MRTLILVVAVMAAVGALLWQAPQIVPEPAHGVLIQTKAKVASAIAQLPALFTTKPSAVHSSALPRGWMLLGAGAGLAVIVVAGVSLLRRRKAAPEQSPGWLSAARTLARATTDSRARLTQCKVIEKTLVTDMKRRGEAALARAHQLDLYWRYVGRANLATQTPAKAATAEKWRGITRQTLDSLTVTPAARTTAVFHQIQPALWALDAGDARELKRYYDQLASLYAEHEKAWTAARELADKPVLDQARLLDAMETLRQINRAIAKETATLVGDIEISVRALS